MGLYSDVFSGKSFDSSFPTINYSDVFGGSEWEDQGIFEVNKKTGERRLKTIEGALPGLSLEQDKTPGAVENLKNIAQFAPLSFGSESAVDFMTQAPEEADAALYASSDVPNTIFNNKADIFDPFKLAILRGATTATVGGGTILAGLGAEAAGAVGLEGLSGLLSDTEQYGRDVQKDIDLGLGEIRSKGAGYGTDVGGGWEEVKSDYAKAGGGLGGLVDPETVGSALRMGVEELGASLTLAALDLPGFVMMGMVPTYNNMKDAGVDTLQAVASSFGSGTAQAALEKFGIDTMLGRSGASQWIAGKLADRVIARKGANALATVLIEGSTEAAQNMLDTAIIAGIANDTANPELMAMAKEQWGTTLDQFGAGAVMGLIGGVGGGPFVLNSGEKGPGGVASESEVSDIAKKSSAELSSVLSAAPIVDKVAKAGGINNADLLDVFDKINAEIASAFEPGSGNMMLSEQELAAKSMNVGARLMELTDKIMDGTIPANQQVRDEFMTTVESFIEMDASREEWANTQLARVDRALEESQKVENLLSDKKKQQMKQLVDTALLNVNKYTEMEVKTLQTEIIPTIMAAVSVKDSAPQVYEILKQKMANEWSKYFSETEIARPEMIDWNAAIQRLKRVNNDRAIESIKGAIDITDEISGTLSADPEGVAALTVDKVAEEKTKLDQMQQQTKNMAADLTQKIEAQTENMLSAQNQDLYEQAVRHVKARRDTTTTGLKEALGISEKLARKLMKAMEENNVVSPPMRVGNKFAGRQLVDDMIAEEGLAVPENPDIGEPPQSDIAILPEEVAPAASSISMLANIVKSARRRGNVESALLAEHRTANETAEAIFTASPRNGRWLQDELGDQLAELATAPLSAAVELTHRPPSSVAEDSSNKRSILDLRKPAVKRALSALYRAGEYELLDDIGELGYTIAYDFTDKVGQDHINQLSRRITAKLKSVFPKIHDNYPVSDPSVNRDVALASAFAAIAHTSFTPHSVRAQLFANGMSEAAITSAMSLIHSMALNWSYRNKGSYISFWQRISDTLMINRNVGKSRGKAASGEAWASKPYDITNWGARAILVLKPAFKSGSATDPSVVDTFIHEVAHQLISSGLILELLDPVHIAALEKYAGGKIIAGGYGPGFTSFKVHEKFAYGLMHFISTGKAPNPTVRNAFKLISDFFGDWLSNLRILVARKLAEAKEALRGEVPGSVGEAEAMNKFVEATERQRNVEKMEDAGFGGSFMTVRVAGGQPAVHTAEGDVEIDEILNAWNDDVVAAFSAMFHNPGIVSKLSVAAPLTGDKTLLLAGAVKQQLQMDLMPAVTAKEAEELRRMGVSKRDTQFMPESRRDAPPPSRAAWEKEHGHEGISEHPDLSEKAEQAYEADKSIYVVNKWGGFSSSIMEVVKNPSKATLIRMAKEQIKKHQDEQVLHYKGGKPESIRIKEIEFRAVKTENGDMYYWVADNGLHSHVAGSLEHAGVDLGSIGEFYYGDLETGFEPSGSFMRRYDAKGESRLNQFADTLAELQEKPERWIDEQEERNGRQDEYDAIQNARQDRWEKLTERYPELDILHGVWNRALPNRGVHEWKRTTMKMMYKDQMNAYLAVQRAVSNMRLPNEREIMEYVKWEFAPETDPLVPKDLVDEFRTLAAKHYWKDTPGRGVSLPTSRRYEPSAKEDFEGPPIGFVRGKKENAAQSFRLPYEVRGQNERRSHVQITKNPTALDKREMSRDYRYLADDMYGRDARRFLANQDELRYIEDTVTGDIYMWNALMATHETVLEMLNKAGVLTDSARYWKGYENLRRQPVPEQEGFEEGLDEMEITKGKLINAVLGQSAALSLLPQQARAQLDASYAALVGSGQSPLNTTPSVDWKNPRGVLNVAVNAGRTFLDKVVHKMFSQRAKVEKWFVDRGLKQYAINFSTLNGVVDRATKVTQIAPQVTDPITLNNIKLPGTRSLKFIMSDLGFWAGLVSKQIGFPIDKVRKDFDLYMTSKRQLEISQNWIKRQQRYVEQVQAWERAGKPEGQKPKKPSRVTVSRKLNAEAHIALAVLEYTYGKETMQQFDRFAKEIVKWGQASIIDKLLHYGMISERAHRAMQIAGEYWIPLEALNEEIVNAGIPEPLNDDSIWNHVHYLQNDTGGERADYLETMIKRAMAVEKVTQRQIAKNKIGQMLMQSPLWWTDTGGFKVLLTNDRPQRVTQAEYMVLPDNRRWEETVVNDKGETVTHYFRVQPLQPTEFASYMQKRPEKKGKVFAMTHMGDKVYIEITDPLMHDAINGMSEVAAEHASKLATAVAKGLDLSKSFNRNFIARAVTTSRTFIYNALPRDAFQAYLRSRFGIGGKNPVLMPIRLIGDLGKGLFQSAGMIFPSLRERFPVAFAAAQKYMEGSAGMSSLGAQFHTVLAADMNALVLEGNVQKKSGILAGMKRDLAERARERGITRGKQKLDTTGRKIRFAANATLESVYFPFEMMTEALEMSWRLRELQLGMQAQFRDANHRNAWEAEKSKMMRDPTYVPDASNVPLVSDSELDYAVRNVTLDFGNHGTWNRTLSSLYIFINPKHQDLYSNAKLMRYGDIAGGKTGSGWATKAAMVTTIKAVGLLTLPLLLEYAMWGDDDDWKGLPFHEKASYIHLYKYPDGSFFKVAAGLSLFNLIFRDSVLAGLLEADRSDPTAFMEWAKRMSEGLPMSAGTGAMQAYWETKVMGGSEGAGSVAMKEFGLGMLPSSLEGAGGLIANRDPFTGKPTQSFAAFKPEIPEERGADRYTWHINRVAQLFSLEPQQAAYLLKKYLPGRFRDPLLPGLPSAMGAMDMMAGATGMQGESDAAPTGFANVGYGSQNPMVTRPQFGPQNEWVQDLNLLFAKAQQVKNTVDRKLEEGKDVEAADIIRKNPIYAYYDQLQEARENVTDLFAARRALMANKDMTDTDKTVISYSEFDKPASTIASDVVREVLLAMEGR